MPLPHLISALLFLMVIWFQGDLTDAKIVSSRGVNICDTCIGNNAISTCFGLKNEGKGQYGGMCNIGNDEDCGDCDAVFIIIPFNPSNSGGGQPGQPPQPRPPPGQPPQPPPPPGQPPPPPPPPGQPPPPPPPPGSGAPVYVPAAGIAVVFNSNKSAYAAFGLSPHKLAMSKLLVFLCNKNHSDVLSSSVLWADGLTRPQQENTTPEVFRSRRDENGTAFCDFLLPTKVAVKGEQFDFINKDYHMLGAIITDRCSENKPFCKHTKAFVTAKPGNITKVRQVTGFKRNEIFHRIHACLQIIAYIGLMPVAILISRFYKETWTGTKLFGGRLLWYCLHVGLLLAALICTLTGYALILLYNEFTPFNFGGRNLHLYHAITGIVIFVYFLSQVVLRFLITPSCPGMLKIYEKMHAVIGVIVYILGVVNIMLTSFFLEELYSIAVIGLIWLLIHGTIFLALTYTLYENDKLDPDYAQDNKRAFIALPMRIHYFMADAPSAKLRQQLLMVFSGSAAIIVILLILQVFIKE